MEEFLRRKKNGKSVYLFDLVVAQGRFIGNVFPHDVNVHVGFDAAGSDGVDSDAFVAEICRV